MRLFFFFFLVHIYVIHVLPNDITRMYNYDGTIDQMGLRGMKKRFANAAGPKSIHMSDGDVERVSGCSETSISCDLLQFK